MAGEIYYPPPPMPQGTLPRIYKVLATTSSTIDTPLPSRRGVLNRIREAWDVVPVGFETPLRQRFFNPKWDIPDDPPVSNAQDVLSLLLNITQQQNKLTDETFAVLLSIVQRRLHQSPGILPSTDNPPLDVFRQRMLKILESYSALERANFTLPKPAQRQSNWLYLPAPIPIELGYIAFQTNAFFCSYPRNDVGFQAKNRGVHIYSTFSKPFIRIVPIHKRRHAQMDDYKRGDCVLIGCRTYDPRVEPEVLFNPESVTLSLFNPDGTARLSNIPLTTVDIGVHIYPHQTAVDDQLGVYLVEFSASNFGNTAKPFAVAMFRIK